MSKLERLNKIKQLITDYEIDTQEELTAKLIENGYDVSQATVSRDINELKLVKTNGLKKKFKYVYFELNKEIPEKTISLFKQVCVSIQVANNLLVIKTLSGNAGSAGHAIDSMDFPQIIGSIAGDDVLLVITQNNNDAEIVLKSLRAL